jgi:hypothetical protein
MSANVRRLTVHLRAFGALAGFTWPLARPQAGAGSPPAGALADSEPLIERGEQVRDAPLRAIHVRPAARAAPLQALNPFQSSNRHG